MRIIARTFGGFLIFSAVFSSTVLAADRHVVVINDTSSALVQLFASNVGTDDWEEDILGQGTVEPGGRLEANIDDGTSFCHYDIKAVFKDGTEAIQRNLDVCAVETWTVHDPE